jgi:ATP-dependent RNA helicase DHX8/PRP22
MFLTGADEISKAVAALQAGVAELPAGACMDLMLLPIYAALPPELQVGGSSPHQRLLNPKPSQP